MTHEALLTSGIAAALFASVFLRGRSFRPLRGVIRDRVLLSFGGGMSIAYAFTRVMPELSEVRESVVRVGSTPTPFHGALVYFVALLGFVAFYGLEELRAHSHREEEGAEHGPLAAHIGGFSVYVWLIAYLLVRGLGESTETTALYAVALALHFVSLDYSLRKEHGPWYDRSGRYVLAAMVAGGWLCGVFVPFPHWAAAALLAFVSGGVIVNSAISELRGVEKGGFAPFLAGSCLYGAILVTIA